MHQLSQIYVYPIKSLGGISLQKSQVTSRGLAFDRRWMLIDENNSFVSQREFHEMALLKVEFEYSGTEISGLLVSHKEKDIFDLEISIKQKFKAEKEVLVEVWGDQVQAYLVSEEADTWFSEVLNKPLRLVYMAEKHERFVEVEYAINREITSFSDGYPILIIGQSSLDDLNARLEQAVDFDRFRPNLVFDGGQPFEEDQWYEFWVGINQFYAVKACGRCVMTTIDQQTGLGGKEPLKTLSTYRKQGKKIMFGQNVLPAGTLGVVNIGDDIEVMTLKNEV